MFHKIINPINNQEHSIFSVEGKKLLKSYVRLSLQNHIGGSNTTTKSKCLIISKVVTVWSKVKVIIIIVYLCNTLPTL